MCSNLWRNLKSNSERIKFSKSFRRDFQYENGEKVKEERRKKPTDSSSMKLVRGNVVTTSMASPQINKKWRACPISYQLLFLGFWSICRQLRRAKIMTTPNQAHIYVAINSNFQVKTDRIIAQSSFIFKLHKGHQGSCSASLQRCFPLLHSSSVFEKKPS